MKFMEAQPVFLCLMNILVTAFTYMPTI